MFGKGYFNTSHVKLSGELHDFNPIRVPVDNPKGNFNPSDEECMSEGQTYIENLIGGNSQDLWLDEGTVFFTNFQENTELEPSYFTFSGGTNSYLGPWPSSQPESFKLNLSGNFTISFWIMVAFDAENPLSPGPQTALMGIGDIASGTGTGLGFYLDNTLRLSFASRDNCARSQKEIEANTWNFITLSKIGAKIKFFINGSYVHSDNDVEVASALSGSHNIYVGKIYNSSIMPHDCAYDLDISESPPMSVSNDLRLGRMLFYEHEIKNSSIRQNYLWDKKMYRP